MLTLCATDCSTSSRAAAALTLAAGGAPWKIEQVALDYLVTVQTDDADVVKHVCDVIRSLGVCGHVTVVGGFVR